jgi:hypothetical protein
LLINTEGLSPRSREVKRLGTRIAVPIFSLGPECFREDEGHRTMRISISIAVLLPLFSSCGLAPSAQAQSCDDACFLIQNAFGQETLKRYIQAFPDRGYVDLANRG